MVRKKLPLKPKWKCDEKFPILAKTNLPQKGKYETKYFLKILFLCIYVKFHTKNLLKVPWQVQHFNVE
jgi:hypothetical protein